MSDDLEPVTFRAHPDLVDALDALADATNTSRSDLLRMGGHYVLETQAEHLEDMAELEAQESDLVDENMKRRNIARFVESTVRRLFLEDLKGDVDATKLPRLADYYRQQARLKEEMARELDPQNPIVEPGELVAKVDDELTHALEASDLSNWYDAHENPYAAELSGVEDGIEEREDLVALVASVVETHASLIQAFSDPDRAPDIDPAELPLMADDLLPENKTRADVADLATRLAREGFTAEQVRQAFEGRGSLDAVTIDAEPASDDLPDAEITRGGAPLHALEDATEDDQQAALPDSIASADGGRSPSAHAAGWQDTEEDTDMSHDTTTTDDDATTAEQLDALDAAARDAAETAGGADDE